MSKQKALGAFAIGAALCAALLGYGLRDSSPVSDAARATSARSAKAPRGSVTLEAPASSQAGREGAESGSGLAPDSQTATETDASRAEPSRANVLVVGPDDEPLAHAQVWVLADADDSARHRFADPAEVDALMETRGEALQSDALGRLDLPRPEDGPTLLAGRHEQLWGQLTLRPDRDFEPTIRLRLELERTVRVRVLDEAGEPVPGVRVEFVEREPWGAWVVQHGITRGHEGIAVLPHVQSLMPRKNARPAVRLDALFENEPMHELEPEDVGKELITLVLPGTASVIVKVSAEDGEPFTGAGTIRLGISSEGEARDVSPFRAQERRRLERAIENGGACFEFVEPGRELEIGVTRDRSPMETRDWVAGPASFGETRTFEVRLGAHHPVAKLRVVDDERNPVLDEHLAVSLRGESSSTGSRELKSTTDEAGFLHLDLALDWHEAAEREIVVFRGSASAPDALGRVAVYRALDDGLNDLGTVVLGAPPVLLRGQVVHAGGAPVSGAALTVERRVPFNPPWRLLSRLREETDDDGRFELRGAPQGDRFRLGVFAKGSGAYRREFQPGEDVLIELADEGFLSGTVLLDPDVDGRKVTLTLAGEAAELMKYSERDVVVGTDHAFRFSRLPAGVYDVHVAIDRQTGGILEIDGITVTAGVDRRDPRLDPLDLRGKLHRHEVTLLGPAEDAALEGQVRFTPTGEETPSEYYWVSRNRFAIHSLSPRLDLELSVAGYVPQALADVSGEIKVELEPAHEVQLVLADGIELPTPPTHFKAALEPEGGFETMLHNDGPAFDASRSIPARAPGTGPMRVIWFVERRSPDSNRMYEVRLEDAQVVQVDGSRNQRIEVTLTPKQREEILTTPR